MRLHSIAALLGIAALLSPAPLLAQVYSIYAPGIIETPHIHLGSATEPSVIQIPPVIVEQPGLPAFFAPPPYYEPEPEAYPPAEFDYLVAPTAAFFPGNMADTSISLGEYAREIRSHKGEGPPPIHLDVNSSQTQ